MLPTHGNVRQAWIHMQVLVDFKEWGDLVELGLRHPGERGKHLENVLRELVAETDRNPSGNAPEYIRRVLDEIAQENSLSEVRSASLCAGWQPTVSRVHRMCKRTLQSNYS
jgi:hypothetical protein